MLRSFLILLSLIVSFTSCNVSNNEILIEAESFTGKGGWVVDPQFVEQMGSPYLLAHGLGCLRPGSIIYGSGQRTGPRENGKHRAGSDS
jgi:hypothetical protein